jgi:hypothetical protein
MTEPTKTVCATQAERDAVRRMLANDCRMWKHTRYLREMEAEAAKEEVQRYVRSRELRLAGMVGAR